MKPHLPPEFFQRKNVVKIAKELLGKTLVTNIEGGRTAGIVVETEAYSWQERGCHAFQGKKTKRNETMFGPGGIAYVYLCYGMYELFNIVTNVEGIAEAVLIRALQPTEGHEKMLTRCKAQTLIRITSGPGKLTKALGISRMHNGVDLNGSGIWLEEGLRVKSSDIEASARIGLNFPGPDALLPWRFTIRNNAWLSK